MRVVQYRIKTLKNEASKNKIPLDMLRDPVAKRTFVIKPTEFIRIEREIDPSRQKKNNCLVRNKKAILKNQKMLMYIHNSNLLKNVAVCKGDRLLDLLLHPDIKSCVTPKDPRQYLCIIHNPGQKSNDMEEKESAIDQNQDRLTWKKEQNYYNTTRHHAERRGVQIR